MLDYATLMEITADKEDFGQTLAVWGWQDSRYLVLPLLGPSTLRDTTGLPADMTSYPLYYVDDDAVRLSLTALNVIDTRAGLLDQEELIRGDRYRFIRDAYLQSRQFEVSDGELGDDPLPAKPSNLMTVILTTLALTTVTRMIATLVAMKSPIEAYDGSF